MPIVVRHTPVGVLGQLAVMAGQARGQQIRAAQDIQLTSLAMAAQDRAAAIGMAAQDRTFALQRAAATQITKRREVEPDVLARRQKLRRLVSEAKSAEIYEPAQIKQMQLFADIGDEKTVRSILGRLPQATVRRRELEQQSRAVAEIGKSEISELQKQLDTVTSQLESRFSPGMQRLIRERPELMETVSPEIQEALVQQQQLEGQIATVAERTAKMGQMLQLGLSIPEQMTFEQKQEARLTKQEELEQRRLARQVRAAGTLTEREELAIDVMRDQEQDQRTTIGREIARLSKDLAPFADEDEGDQAERIKPIQVQIRQLELERTASFSREKKRIAEFLGKGRKTVTPIVTGADGRRWRFTGRYRDGKPLYEEIE